MSSEIRRGSGTAAKPPAGPSAKTHPLRILILGGTEFLGIHMVEIAQQRGHTVTLFNRGRTKPKLFPHVERLKGDRDGRLEALKERQWDAVIDTCGYVPRHVRTSAELLAPHIRQYLFISTVGVYSEWSKANDESSSLEKIDDEECEDWQSAAHGALKALCEKTIDAVLPGRTTMVRPGLIVGPHDPTDRFTYWAARAVRGGEMLVSGDPQASYQMIDARDLAAFCIEALENRTFGVFNVTSPPGLFTRESIVQEAVAAAASALRMPSPPPQPTWVSAEFIREQKAQRDFDSLRWFEGGAMSGLDHMNVERAVRAGLRISPLQKTMRDTLAWHLTRPEEERMKLRAGIAPKRELELIAAWKEQNKDEVAASSSDRSLIGMI